VKNEWKYTSIPHTPPSSAQRQLYFNPYYTVEKIKRKRIRNILFTDAGIQNLLPDLKEKRQFQQAKKETVQ